MNYKNTLKLIAILILSFQAGISIADAKDDQHPTFYVGGIQVNEPDNEKWVKTLKSTGFNTVSVTVYARQGNWDSDKLTYPTEDVSVIDEIRTAKSNGLNVILIMRVALDHYYPKNPFLWHGMIMPATDGELSYWFEKYTDYVATWAEIAEKENVDVFVIGSEMNSLTSTKRITELPNHIKYFSSELKQQNEKTEILKHSSFIKSEDLFNPGKKEYSMLDNYLDDRSMANKKWADQISYINSQNRLEKINERKNFLNTHWIRLIKDVKSIYDGKISYAANFDNYQDVDFWKYLDFISINAYFPLRKNVGDFYSKKQLMVEAENSWKNIFSEIKDFRTKEKLANKKVLFTEIGYTYRKNSTINPWESRGFALIPNETKSKLIVWDKQPLDLEERSVAIKSLYNVCSGQDEDLLQGILYWKLTTIKKHYEIEPFVVYLGPDMPDPLVEDLKLFRNKI